MIEGTLHIDGTLASLKAVEARFRENARFAVLNTAKTMMGRIVEKTLAPAPPPPVKYYVRTHRLVSGWQPAASFVGISTPGITGSAKGSNEGKVELIVGEQEIVFRATNEVPYASAVEIAGTWATPFDSRRPGYFIVLRSTNETREDFTQNLQYAWGST